MGLVYDQDSSTNRVSTVTVSDQSIAGGQTEEDVSSVKGIDPDGDPIIRYEIKDTVGINNWLMDRTAVDTPLVMVQCESWTFAQNGCLSFHTDVKCKSDDEQPGVHGRTLR